MPYNILLPIMVTVLILRASPSFSDLTGPRNFTGSQVLRVYTQDEDFIRSIYEQGFDVWSGNSTCSDIFIEREKLNNFKQTLKKNNMKFQTVISDLQRLIDNGNLLPTKYGTRIRGGNGMNWQQYHSLQTIHEYLDELAQRYKQVTTIGVMGHSAEGNPLKYIKISSGVSGSSAVFIDGGIHAREWISPASVTYLIYQLVENRTNLPLELVKIDFYILPVFNPDGYVYSHQQDRLWRKNRSKGVRCSGVDLNRNFEFHWGGKGSSQEECSEVYRGTHPASEPETQAVQKFISDIKTHLKAYITFHSYGQYILMPYGFDRNYFADSFDEMTHVAEAASREILKSNRVKYKIGNSAHLLYPAAGTSEDWVKARANVKYSFCIELRDTGEFGFILPSSSIIPTALDAFQAVKVISIMATKA